MKRAPDIIDRPRRIRGFWYGQTATKSYWSVADRLIVSGVNFITMVAVGRAAGLSDLGVFALAWTVLLAVVVVQEAFIVSPFTVNDSRFGDDTGRKTYSGAVLIQQMMLLAMATIVLVIAAGTSTLLGMDASISGTAWCLVLAVPAFAAREFARRFYLARLEVGRLLLLDGAAAALQLAGLGLLWFHGALSPRSVLLAIALASALPAMHWLYANHRQFALPAREYLIEKTREHWTFGRWVCAGQMSDLATSHGIAWLVAGLAGTAATGLFAACNSLLMVANPLIFGIGSILLPRAAQANNHDGIAEVRRIVLKGMMVIVLAVGLLCMAVAAVGEILIGALYSLDAVQGITLIVFLLALANIAGAAGLALDSGLMVIRRPDINAAASVAGLMATILFGWLLIPQLLAAGAAGAVLAGSVVATLLQLAAFVRLAGASGSMGGSKP